MTKTNSPLLLARLPYLAFSIAFAAPATAEESRLPPQEELKPPPPKSPSKPPCDGVDLPEPGPWSDLFEVYEQTASGQEIPLPFSKAGLVIDRLSSLLIRRSSAGPEQLRVRSTAPDDAADAPDFLDVDAWIHEGNCRHEAIITNLTETYRTRNGAQLLDSPDPACPQHPRVKVTEGKRVAKDMDMIVRSDNFQKADKVELQFWGKSLYEQPFVKDNSVVKCALPAHNSTLEVAIIDAHALVPFEKDGATTVRADDGVRRVSTESDVVIDYADRPKKTVSNSRFLLKSLSIEAHAISGDGEDRPLKVVDQAQLPRIQGGQVHDGEWLRIRISRKLSDGSEILLNEFNIPVAAVGFHYAPIGDWAARYATASHVVIPFADETPLRYGQTFTYSFFYRDRTPGFWDHFAGGFHIALLAGDADHEDDEDQALTPGFGGQVTLGYNLVHLGGGVLLSESHHGYVFIGLAISDLAEFANLPVPAD